MEDADGGRYCRSRRKRRHRARAERSKSHAARFRFRRRRRHKQPRDLGTAPCLSLISSRQQTHGRGASPRAETHACVICDNMVMFVQTGSRASFGCVRPLRQGPGACLPCARNVPGADARRSRCV